MIPSQISPGFIERLRAALALPPDKVLDCTDILQGDTYTTSILLALHHARKAGRIADGQKIAFLAFGSGVTAAGAVYHC